MTKIVYLQPQAGYKSALRSDTLWGMLCWAIRQVYGETRLQSFLTSYLSPEHTPEFIISSAFPYKQTDEERICYFPRPIMLYPFREKLSDYVSYAANTEKYGNVQQAGLFTLNDKKKVRKETFLAEDVFLEVLQGTKGVQALEQLFLDESGKETGQQNPHYQSPKPKSLMVTHNTIDRFKGGTLNRDGGGQLFHVEEQVLEATFGKMTDQKNTVGLFFLAQGNTKIMEGALRYLAHVGLGGDRYIGKGAFRIKCEEYPWPKVENPNAMMNLSLYFPRFSELQKFKGNPYFNYRLENRQGRLSSKNTGKYLKKPVMMFAEGSTFPLTDSSIQHWGTIKDVTFSKAQKAITGHPIYHNGMALMMPMKIDLPVDVPNFLCYEINP